MPHLTTDHSVKLYFEDAGTDIPIVFIQGFMLAGRSWLWRPTPVPGSRFSYRTPPVFLGRTR
jgi:pimeloyl-ACP methyl ester carboxylesterase